MNPFATPVRYWTFQDRTPIGLDEGHVMVGGAVHAETRERLTAVRVFDNNAPELVSELWLTELETVELAERLLGMESYYHPARPEPRTVRGAKAE